MFMARTLGRTLEELADSMSAAEFGDWAALYALEREQAAGQGAQEPTEPEMDVTEFLNRAGKHG